MLMKTVFDWEHFALYLSGPIDFAADGGFSWRDEWTQKLIQIGINPKQIYNPCRKPLHGAQFNLDNEQDLAHQCREKEDWDQLDNILGQIMHVDLRMLDKSDIILVNFPRIGKTELIRQIRMGEHLQKDIFSFNDVNELIRQYENMRVPTYGTIHEIVVAHLQRKPIFIVWEETGKKDCSAWLMRLVGHEHVFSDIDTLITHLDNVSHGKTAFNANEWLLLDPQEA